MADLTPQEIAAKYGVQVAPDPQAIAAKYGVDVSPVSQNPNSPPAIRPTEGSALSRFASGAWDMAKGAASGIGSAINAASSPNPYDAMKFGTDIALSHLDQARKAKEALGQGSPVEAAGHAIAAAVPMVGPAAAHAGERMGGTQPKYDKYGNVVEQGQAPDIAGGMGESGILLAPSVARVAGPPAVRAAATAADRMGIPEALERSAGVSYRKMLTPTAKGVVTEAESIAGGPSEKGPTGLVKTRPVAMTRKGMMEKSKATMEEVGPQTSTIYNNKPPLDPQPILDHLEQLRQQKAVVRGSNNVVSDPVLNNAIDELKQNIEDMRDPDGKVAAVSLDDFKDKLNRGLVSPKGHMRQLSPQTASAIEKSVAGNIGGYLDSIYPDAARVNAAYRTAKGTKTFLEEQRQAEIAAESGVRTGSSSGFGAALKKMVPAPLRGIPNAISALTDSVAWDSVSGATKAKIADLIRRGSLDQAAAEMKLLGQGDIVTPAPPDTSSVRSRGNAPHEEVNRMRPALGPGPFPFSQGTGIPDILGRPDLRTPYRAGLLEPGPNPQVGGPSVQGSGVGSGNRGTVINLPYEDKSFARGVNAPINPKTGLPWTAEEIKTYLASLPKFAKGGTIRRPTLLSDLKTGKPTGIMAEAGPEAIVPLGSPSDPTAANPTVPEQPATLKSQLGQLSDGLRRVVMFPAGTPLLKRPKGMNSYQDSSGNTYIFDPSAISTREIDKAITGDDLPSILGAADGGMGAPDKKDLKPPVMAVVGTAPDGTTTQATATDRMNKNRAIAQTAKVTPRGTVRVEHPSREIKRRIMFPDLRSPAPL